MAIGPIVRGLTYGTGLFALEDATRLYNQRSALAGEFQSNIRFPSDLNANTPFMSMQFSSYRRRSINEQPFYNREMKIVLPVPENLTEAFSLGYSKENLGSVVGSIAEVASRGVPNSIAGIGSALGDAASGIGVGVARGVLSTIANNIPGGQETTNRAINAISALSGITTNPFQVVLFKSPEFRSHQFSWRFIPKYAEESEVIRNIVETFRYHAHPGISETSGVFFSYPEILEINFRPRDNYLYKFKPCVVESVRVNYAPNSPSFYKSTGAPTAVEFSIRVQEIEIWTKADYLRERGRAQNTTNPGPRVPPAPRTPAPGGGGAELAGPNAPFGA